MSRLTQIIQNSFLRFEGFLSVLLKNLTNFIRNIFGFFANLFGYSSSTQYLESDETQSIKQSSTKQPTQTVQDNTPEITTKRRRPDAKMDYYLKMAREITKK